MGKTASLANIGSIADSSLGFRNRIINGAMVIDQRNAGASSTVVNNTYYLDRWNAVSGAASKFSVQQNAGAVTPPAGFVNYLGCTSLSSYSVGAAENFGVRQFVEGFNAADLGWGTANANTVTVSFWVYSSLTGTFGGSISNNAANRSYPFAYTISAANTWEQKSVTIAGDTTGTWEKTNLIGIRLNFGLGAGATNSGTAGAWAAVNYFSATGATSVVGTNGATWYITGVQLEKGSTATSFDYRPYGTELALCQRYYARMTAGAAYTAFAVGVVQSATAPFAVTTKLPVTMRATPSISYSNIRVYDGSVAPAITSTAANYSSPDFWSGDFGASGGGLTTGRAAIITANNNSAAYIDATSEL